MLRRFLQRLRPQDDPAPRHLGMTHAESAAYQARVQRILAASIPDLPPDLARDAAVERIVASGRHSGPYGVVNRVPGHRWDSGGTWLPVAGKPLGPGES